ncbi:uncharacterized protein [Fopius arisanus]|uniref:Uncharacterized protein n=1 Tax=Fopius arisanus TaxID=64838 RepID=A0A9R1TW76_9HYME|nr:PREDICTED: uncharacterized protein LOC105264778 [Fopius arisanus]
MELQWHAFHILFVVFTAKVLSDEVLPTGTAFFGLQGDSNLGHSGYVHVSTDEVNPIFELSSCQALDINESTCHFAHKHPKPENNLMVMRSWVAVTIRDNILGLLGYLLHQPNDDVFPEDTYTSLKIVYEEILKNNIRTMDILPRLRSIAKGNPVSQVIDLFKTLQNVLPAFCKSAIDEIVRTFTKHRTALKTIIAETSDKGIDVFADIGLQMIPYLNLKDTKQSYEKSSHSEMGKEFTNFISAIQESKIILTQPVLASLMLNMRFSQLSPGDREDFRFLTDVLRDSKIPDWSPSLIGAVNVKCPYALVQMMMKAIANRSQIDPIVKEIAGRLHNQLQKVSKSHRSRLMDPYFGKSELNIPLLLNVLEEEAKIPEVQTFKQMINDHSLSLSYALKGFVRYFYPTPRDLVFAFTRRIQDRVPMNNETWSTVSKIVTALNESIEKTSVAMSINEQNETRSKRSIAQDCICDFLTSSHLTENPTFYADRQCIHGPKCFSKIFDKIANSFHSSLFTQLHSVKASCPEEPAKISLSAWLETLNKSVANPNITLLLENISTILTIFIQNNEIKAIIDGIINQNPAHGNRTVLNSSAVLEDSIMNEMTNSTATSIETNKDLLSRVLKNMLNIKKVRARPFVFYEVIRVYCILIHVPIERLTPSFLDKLHLDEPPMRNITDIFVEGVSDLMKGIIQNLTANVKESSLNLKDYKTNRQYLEDLLRKTLLLETVQQDSQVFNEVVQLLRPIQDLPIRLFPLIGMSYVPLAWRYLEKPGILQKLGEDFDMGRFPTRGRFLRAILEKSLTTLFVRGNETLSRAIKEQISLVLCTDAGAEPVREILEGITTDQVNVYKIIQYGLDRQKLTADVQEAYANMWNWYGGSFQPLTHVKLMNISLYNTRSDFLTGFLDKVEAEVGRDFNGMKRDIELMRSAILLTGTGAEPVDYL